MQVCLGFQLLDGLHIVSDTYPGTFGSTKISEVRTYALRREPHFPPVPLSRISNCAQKSMTLVQAAKCLRREPHRLPKRVDFGLLGHSQDPRLHCSIKPTIHTKINNLNSRKSRSRCLVLVTNTASQSPNVAADQHLQHYIPPTGDYCLKSYQWRQVHYYNLGTHHLIPV